MMLNDVECQVDQPNTVKNVSLYLTAPGSNPGARILKIMLLQLRMRIVHFGYVSRV